jgi:hypothetical protein
MKKLNRRQIRGILLREMSEFLETDTSVSGGDFEFVPAGQNNQDQLIYHIQTESGNANGAIYGSQKELMAADALMDALNSVGGLGQDDLIFRAENFGYIWSEWLKRKNNLNVSPESLKAAALQGRLRFKIKPAPRNQTFGGFYRY